MKSEPGGLGQVDKDHDFFDRMKTANKARHHVDLFAEMAVKLRAR